DRDRTTRSGRGRNALRFRRPRSGRGPTRSPDFPDDVAEQRLSVPVARKIALGLVALPLMVNLGVLPRTWNRYLDVLESCATLSRMRTRGRACCRSPAPPSTPLQRPRLETLASVPISFLVRRGFRAT